jgi:hypothetical protein
MKYLMEISMALLITIVAAGALAQEPTSVLISETAFDADVVVIPFPDKATTITFALTDPDAPDPVSLHFEYPTTQTFGAWAAEVNAAVQARLAETEQGVLGLGGDARQDAIKSVYRDEIAAQKNIEGLLQHYLTALVKLRFRLEMLRQLAAAQ